MVLQKRFQRKRFHEYAQGSLIRVCNAKIEERARTVSNYIILNLLRSAWRNLRGLLPHDSHNALRKEANKMNEKANGAIAKATGWLAVGVYAAMGLFSIFLPEQASIIILYSVAAVLSVLGAYGVISYFISKPKPDAKQGYALAIGLSLLTLGIVIVAIPQQLVNLIVFLVGAALIIGGYAKIQLTFDAKRRGEQLWWVYLAAAVVSLTLGVIIITTRASTMFFGISLVVEAVLDATAIIIRKIEAKKRASQANVQAGATPPITPALTPKPPVVQPEEPEKPQLVEPAQDSQPPEGK